MNKKYMLINKVSGKKFRRAGTREEARSIKRLHGFKHAIVNTCSLAIVR